MLWHSHARCTVSAHVPSTGAAATPAGATQLGEYTLGAPLFRLRIAEAYAARGSQGPVTLLVINPQVAKLPGAKTLVENSAAQLAELAPNPALVRCRGAGSSGSHLFVVLDAVEGTSLRDVLARKTGGGLDPRSAGNVVARAAEALAHAGIDHGVIGTDSMLVQRNGALALIDLALAPAMCMALSTRTIPSSGTIAPEVAERGLASGQSDVFGLGSLLYECLVGRPLERGGPRPSEVVPGLKTQADELIARACHRNPENRFNSAAVFGEVVVDAFGHRGAIETLPPPTTMTARGSGNIPPVTGASPVNAADNGALAAALADPTEHWLVAKGKFDFGPFTLAHIVEQIRSGEIVAGHMLMDKDTGARTDVATQPLLAPLLEAARLDRDHRRRAQAEDAHQSKQKVKGAMLYLLIAGGVAAAVIVVLLVMRSTRSEERRATAQVSAVGEASLKITMSPPKKPAAKARSNGSRKASGSSGGGGDDDLLALDLSDEGDGGSATLDMDTVYQVYSRQGGQLGGCLRGSGGGSASISIIIDGPTGKVNWVRVNGENSGGLHGCISRVMRSLKFPAIDGVRTRAEFDISI
jgi:hypothetical protein